MKPERQARRYFLDNTFPPQFQALLTALDVDAVHIASVPGLARDAEDTVWIPAVASHGWIAVSGDCRILTRPSQRKAVVDAGLVLFAMRKRYTNLRLWDQAVALMRAWPSIEAAAEWSRSGQCFEVFWEKGPRAVPHGAET